MKRLLLSLCLAMASAWPTLEQLSNRSKLMQVLSKAAHPPPGSTAKHVLGAAFRKVSAKVFPPLAEAHYVPPLMHPTQLIGDLKSGQLGKGKTATMETLRRHFQERESKRLRMSDSYVDNFKGRVLRARRRTSEDDSWPTTFATFWDSLVNEPICADCTDDEGNPDPILGLPR